jgi:hypothetical protein
MSTLFVVIILGGLVENLPTESAIWYDLDGGNKWQALCTASQADNIASLAGGEEVSREEWDGSTFGDGHSGHVFSPCKGIMDDTHATPNLPLPSDWVALSKGSFQDFAKAASQLPVEEQEAAIRAVADAATETDDEEQEFAEELRDTLTLITAA